VIAITSWLVVTCPLRRNGHGLRPNSFGRKPHCQTGAKPGDFGRFSVHLVPNKLPTANGKKPHINSRLEPPWPLVKNRENNGVLKQDFQGAAFGHF